MRISQAKLAAVLLVLLLGRITGDAVQTGRSADEEFGPVVRAYLGYLRNEQEVVDDRVSRREISATYYRRNSNRIKALRQMAIRLARDTNNDYLPELEAVTSDEFRLLFERPPQVASLRAGEVLRNTFRYLGTVRTGESFYVFARLDPYEQAEPVKPPPVTGKTDSPGMSAAPPSVRSRRVTP
jgi:hypothetical protein